MTKLNHIMPFQAMQSVTLQTFQQLIITFFGWHVYWPQFEFKSTLIQIFKTIFKFSHWNKRINYRNDNDLTILCYKRQSNEIIQANVVEMYQQHFYHVSIARYNDFNNKCSMRSMQITNYFIICKIAFVFMICFIVSGRGWSNLYFFILH